MINLPPPDPNSDKTLVMKQVAILKSCSIGFDQARHRFISCAKRGVFCTSNADYDWYTRTETDTSTPAMLLQTLVCMAQETPGCSRLRQAI